MAPFQQWTETRAPWYRFSGHWATRPARQGSGLWRSRTIMNGLREALVRAARKTHPNRDRVSHVVCARWQWWGAVVAALVGCDGSSHELRRPTPNHESKPLSPEQAPTRSAVVHAEGERAPKATAQPLPRLPSYRKHAGVEQPRSQLVACSELGFVRLLPVGFEGYRLYDRSLTFRSTKRTFTHVVAQAGHSYLLLGPHESLLYYQPHTRVEALARLPALGPFRIWPDARHHEWVWVHYLRDDAVHRFELPRLTPPGTDEQKSAKASLQTSVELAGFDRKSVERTVYGRWVYTRAEDDAAIVLMSGFGEGVAHVRAASVTLTIDERIGRTNEPTARSLVVELAGYPFSVVEAEGRLAVVTHTARADGRDWQLEVIEASGHVHRVTLPNRTGSVQAAHVDEFAEEVANRSVCLVPGKPWAVVGGRTSVRLFDYRTSTPLLALER